MQYSKSSYAPHETLVRPARAFPELWRFAVGLGLAAATMISLNMMFISMLGSLLAPDRLEAFLAGLRMSSTPITTIISLASFGFMTIGVCFAAYIMQSRPPISLIGPWHATVAGFWVVCRALIIVYVVLLILPPWDMGGPLVPNLAFGTWIALLPVSLLVVLIQASAEEIVFRGYIQQQLAARFSSPWLWMVLPSALFGFAHYTPAEAGGNAVLIGLWATLFGLLMADLTARSGTLGPAIAVHFVTNVSALLLTSLPDTLSGLALYTVPFTLADEAEMRVWLPVDFAVMIVTWLAARLALRR